MATATYPNGNARPGRGGEEADCSSSSQRIASGGDPAARDLPAFALANLGDIFRRDVGLKRASAQTRGLYAAMRAIEGQ